MSYGDMTKNDRYDAFALVGGAMPPLPVPIDLAGGPACVVDQDDATPKSIRTRLARTIWGTKCAVIDSRLKQQIVKETSCGETDRDRVYILRCGEFVKIGVTRRGVRKRVEVLQIGNPYDVTVVAVIRGGFKVEGALHRRFESDHHRGEWFRATRSLLVYVQQFHNVKVRAEGDDLFQVEGA